MKWLILVLIVAAGIGFFTHRECFDGRGAIACLASKP